MVSFLKALFGKGSGGGEPAGQAVEYNGYMITPTPYAESGQFQTAGRIEKTIDGTVRTYSFVRAEKHPVRDDAVEFSLTKARLIIDQQGDRIFQG